MSSWANVDRIWDNGFGGSRNGRSIEGAVIHHAAGTDAQAYVAQENSRDSHPSYHIKSSGYLTGIVHPNRRPFSTSHSVDGVAITFEIDNSSTGGDWPISDKALSRLIDVCVYHAREQGFKKFGRNQPGVDQPDVFFIAWHSQYVATACPGPYILSRIDYIIAECQRRLNGGAPVPPTPTPVPAAGWELAPGGEPNAPHWPVGPIMERVQRGLALKGRYSGKIDGIGGPLTAAGIQRTLNYSEMNGIQPYVPTPEDSKLGINNAYGVQWYARKYGNYSGKVDGDPRENSWNNFALGLERP